MTVHLVGAGPGDPRLLTRRAARLLSRADVVVADRPSLGDVVALAPPQAERVYVGRTEQGPAWPLEQIVELLASRAGAVVRLKSGDPFLCSRGAEEAAALTARGVEWTVTPGVTAATAAPLAAGLVRGRCVHVASGDADPLAAPVPWESLTDPCDTVVVLTGRAHQGRIAAALMAGGTDPGATATVISAATRPHVRVVTTTVAELGSVRLPPPAAFVIGGAGAHP